MAVSDLSASQFDRAREPGGRERDGEIMGMEGERRLTQSLMSFLGFWVRVPWLRMWVDWGLWSRKEQTKPRSAEIDFYIKESSPTWRHKGWKAWHCFKVFVLFWQQKMKVDRLKILFQLFVAHTQRSSFSYRSEVTWGFTASSQLAAD